MVIVFTNERPKILGCLFAVVCDYQVQLVPIYELRFGTRKKRGEEREGTEAKEGICGVTKEARREETGLTEWHLWEKMVDDMIVGHVV